MTTPKTLNDRVLEANAIAALGKIVGRDRHNRVNSVIVPGSMATQNHVIIRRSVADGIVTVTTECTKMAGYNGHQACKGNLSGFCRHSLAAIKLAMEDAGYAPRFRSEYENAEKFAQAHKDVALEFEGQPVVFTLRSWQSRNAKPVYMVAIDTTANELK